MEKNQGRVGVHRIWDLTRDPEKKALLVLSFSWASHKSCVTPQRCECFELSRISRGRIDLSKPRFGAGNCDLLGHSGKVPSSSRRKVLTFPPLSPGERDG